MACPLYMAMGMTYEQFWEGEATMASAFRKADEIRRKRRNEELWLEGIYTAEALSATVGNMFSKGEKHQYPSEPKRHLLGSISKTEAPPFCRYVPW